MKLCQVGWSTHVLWGTVIVSDVFDTNLTFPVLSCTSSALSKIILQILKLGLYFESNASFEVWAFIKTMFPMLKSVLSGSLIGGGHLSLNVLRSNIAIM